MNISDYLSQREKSSLMARFLGVTPSFVSQWKSGFRPVPVEFCAQIEEATTGEVMRWDLRPDDWWKIWPELTERKDAPPIPEQAHE